MADYGTSWKDIFRIALTRPFVLFVYEPIIQLLGLYMALLYGNFYRMLFPGINFNAFLSLHFSLLDHDSWHFHSRIWNESWDCGPELYSTWNWIDMRIPGKSSLTHRCVTVGNDSFSD